jgi:hypothetical protein
VHGALLLDILEPAEGVESFVGSLVGHEEAVVGGAGEAAQILGIGQGVADLHNILAVARLALIAHAVGVGGVGVGAVEHVAVELVLAELVLVDAVEGHQFRFLFNVQQTLLRLSVADERVLGRSREPVVSAVAAVGLLIDVVALRVEASSVAVFAVNSLLPSQVFGRIVKTTAVH